MVKDRRKSLGWLFTKSISVSPCEKDGETIHMVTKIVLTVFFLWVYGWLYMGISVALSSKWRQSGSEKTFWVAHVKAVLWVPLLVPPSHDVSPCPLSPMPWTTPGPLSWTLPNWAITWNRLQNFYFLHMERSGKRPIKIQPVLINSSHHLQTTEVRAQYNGKFPH